MKFVVVATVALGFIAGCLAQCNFPNTFADIGDAIHEGVDVCDYPTSPFNTSCVGKSCPGLLNNPSLCPFNADKSVNLDAVKSILLVLNNCFRNKIRICGVDTDPITMPQLSFFIKNFLTSLNMTGKCTVEPECYITNLSGATYSVSSNQSNAPPGSVYVDTKVKNLTYHGNGTCKFYVLPGTPQEQMFGNSLNFGFTNITWITTLLATSSANLIDFDKDQPVDKVQLPGAQASFNLNNYDVPQALVALLFHAILNLVFQSFIQQSAAPTDIAKFLTNIGGYAIEAAKANCA